ncbi:GatB/YqeY [Candidatus Saccharibacteria bacterium 32-50-10]|nr:MAG: GatB/YqeY [Candidatus Saccharibacteria bacterium 32-50-10]
MSALKQRISQDTKAAFLGGDRFRGEVLRNLQAAILNEEVALGKREEGLSDAELEKVLAREAKKRVESAELYRSNGRVDLAEPEEQELVILQEYLPEQMSESDIKSLVDEVILSMGEANIQQMGQVIGAVKSKAGNAADGAVIARIVKETLTK